MLKSKPEMQLYMPFFMFEMIVSVGVCYNISNVTWSDL